MPAKRSSNAQRKKPAAAAGSGIANDLIGVGIIVVAMAMIVSLVSPSSAIVTHAMAEGLRLGFGEGAMLVPFALILFAVTMFLPMDSSLVARVAVGLALVVLSALSMLSILVPGSDAQPALVLEADVASSYGGYVGSGVAWLLLTYVGQLVGMVLLVGMAVCGIVVCGFSISNLVLRIRNSLGVAAEHIAAAHETHSTRRREDREAVEAAAWDEPEVSEPETAVMDEPETSFIGSRKTSVLPTRRPRSAPWRSRL